MHKIDLGGDFNRVHFIGIGGVSMSGLAEILQRDGYAVSGSDAVDSDTTAHLRTMGINVAIGNVADNITDGIDLVVHTAAVTPDNLEYKAAQARNIPIIDRARLFGLIMRGYQYTVCVAGSHGKTGTTAMLADACLTAGLDPTIQVGGYMGDGFNFRVGQSPYMIMEACEYFDSFLQWQPYIGIILNIDNDHMDYFGSMDRLIASFAQFARNIRPEGTLIIYGGTPGFDTITQDLSCRVITYGTDNARFTSAHMTFDVLGRPAFDVLEDGKKVMRINLKLHGAQYALNALSVAAACLALGMTPDEAGQSISSARGVKRRYEHKGIFNGADIVDDYAHHPTEIKATLAAARVSKPKNTQGAIICLFQPHTFSRTEYLLDDFASAFSDADWVVVLPIFASREAFNDAPAHQRIDSRCLADKIHETGQAVWYADSFDEAEKMLRERVIPGDLLITMGAGDVHIVGERLLRTGLSTISTGV